MKCASLLSQSSRLVTRPWQRTKPRRKSDHRAQQRSRSPEPPSCSQPSRSGVAVVEFAVVAPLFFLLILGMIEFGRMVMVQQVITNASREGARTAIVQGATTSDVVGVVNNYLAGGGVRGATVAVSPDPIDLAGYGDPVTVTVSVPFRQVSWLPAPMFLGDTELRAITTMRREAVQ
jgi:hypothetical protein